MPGAMRGIDARFQHTAARRRLQLREGKAANVMSVSTHSRPKAAARAAPTRPSTPLCFNTQPPEGGCRQRRRGRRWRDAFMFQHTAARRRLQI